MKLLGSLLLFALVAAGVAAEPTAPSPAPRSLLVPAYFYPSGQGLQDWDRLIAAAKKARVVAIANPASGPGERVDPNYTDVLDRAEKGGVVLVGYVSTSYAKRALEDVEADVDRWKRQYPQVRGIFFDEQTSGADRVEYYRALYEHARKSIRDALVITNPGTSCAQEYLKRPATDVACIWENRTGYEEYRPPAWTARFPPRRFAILLYDVKEASRMEQGLRKAAREGAGYIFVTDAAGANPWDRLPSYWDAEVAAVGK